MWWECSECGGLVERPKRPVACRECGTAGVIFVVADEPGDTQVSADGLRAAWLRAGLERGHPVGA